MPVGQAVIATRVFGFVGSGLLGRGGGLRLVGGVEHLVDEGDDLVGCRRVAQRLRRSPCAPARAPGWTAASCARRRRASGAAIRNARSAGPSGAPKSTGGCSRANPMDAVSTCGERQCGIAMPPGNPVADCSSRAIAAAISPSGSVVRPASARLPTSRPITACLSAPASTSSRTRSVSMMVGKRCWSWRYFRLVVTNWRGLMRVGESVKSKSPERH